ncbi:MAG: ribonuclease P protein component [Actinobacteria bacterium]|nr:MAG: ribonuclease P protein component [Actinomycetota bacterium]
MPRAGRLTSSADFRRIYTSGRRSSAGMVVVHALATGEDRPARVGISAVRGLGGSVQRNRAKRRLREAVRPLRESLAAGLDVIFVATSSAERVGFQKLADNARAGASKVGALRA